MGQKRKVNFEIVKEIAVLQESSNLWRKELNLVSWNGAEPKYDIRWWPPGKTSSGKGITFALEELHLLAEVIKNQLPKDTHLISK